MTRRKYEEEEEETDLMSSLSCEDGPDDGRSDTIDGGVRA